MLLWRRLYRKLLTKRKRPCPLALLPQLSDCFWIAEQPIFKQLKGLSSTWIQAPSQLTQLIRNKLWMLSSCTYHARLWKLFWIPIATSWPNLKSICLVEKLQYNLTRVLLPVLHQEVKEVIRAEDQQECKAEDPPVCKADQQEEGHFNAKEEVTQPTQPPQPPQLSNNIHQKGNESWQLLKKETPVSRSNHRGLHFHHQFDA